MKVVRAMPPVVTKTLTYNEETEVLGAVYTAVAYYKLMAKVPLIIKSIGTNVLR